MSNLITTVTLTVMMASLLTLTFHNDDALAAVFHVSPFWWALFVHAAIITLPPIVALLPSQEEKTQARNLWHFALFVALAGNIAGSISHAAGVTFHQVLGANFGTASYGVLIASCVGGILLVSSEYVVGNLWEKSIARTAEAVALWWKSRPQKTETQAPQTREKARVIARPVSVPQIESSPPVEATEGLSAPLAPWLESPKQEAQSKPKKTSKQATVFAYLDEHPNAKYVDVSEACDVSVDLARQYAARWRKSLQLVPAESVQVETHLNGKNH